MKTVEVQIPEPLFRQAQDIAARENMPVDHVLSLAVCQSLGQWSVDSRSPGDTHPSDRRRFLERLQRTLDGRNGAGHTTPVEST